MYVWSDSFNLHLPRIPGHAILVLAAAGLLVASWAWAGPAENARIHQRVVARLAGQVGIEARDLQIEVDDGVVRLRGSVSSIGELRRLSRLVYGIVGVRGVINQMTVRPSPRSDSAIQQDILRLLGERPRYRDDPIQVTVSGGRVVLSGTVDRAVDRFDAEEIASNVQGVIEVSNELQVPGVGSTPPEAILQRVHSALTNPLSFGLIRNLTVELVGDGVVRLRGTARLEADREAAERIALTVPGVSRVINEIDVLGS